MTDKTLEAAWRAVRRELLFACLCGDFPIPPEVHTYIDQNELELAWDTLADFAGERPPIQRAEFWSSMSRAAAAMGLPEKAELASIKAGGQGQLATQSITLTREQIAGLTTKRGFGRVK